MLTLHQVEPFAGPPPDDAAWPDRLADRSRRRDSRREGSQISQITAAERAALEWRWLRHKLRFRSA